MSNSYHPCQKQTTRVVTGALGAVGLPSRGPDGDGTHGTARRAWPSKLIVGCFYCTKEMRCRTLGSLLWRNFFVTNLQLPPECAKKRAKQVFITGKKTESKHKLTQNYLMLGLKDELESLPPFFKKKYCWGKVTKRPQNTQKLSCKHTCVFSHFCKRN